MLVEFIKDEDLLRSEFLTNIEGGLVGPLNVVFDAPLGATAECLTMLIFMIESRLGEVYSKLVFMACCGNLFTVSDFDSRLILSFLV